LKQKAILGSGLDATEVVALDKQDPWKPLVALILLLFLVPFLVGGFMMMPMGPWMMGGAWGPWWGLAMLVLWIVIMVSIGVALVATVRPLPWSKPQEQETPLEILKRRYARGEINREEYERMKQELSS
jgi:putative membrane protein